MLAARCVDCSRTIWSDIGTWPVRNYQDALSVHYRVSHGGRIPRPAHFQNAVGDPMNVVMDRRGNILESQRAPREYREVAEAAEVLELKTKELEKLIAMYGPLSSGRQVAVKPSPSKLPDLIPAESGLSYDVYRSARIGWQGRLYRDGRVIDRWWRPARRYAEWRGSFVLLRLIEHLTPERISYGK